MSISEFNNSIDSIIDEILSYEFELEIDLTNQDYNLNDSDIEHLIDGLIPIIYEDAL